MTTTTTQGDPILTTSETAIRLGLSAHTVRLWAKAGKLPCVRLIERSIRFRLSDVEALIDEHRRAD